MFLPPNPFSNAQHFGGSHMLCEHEPTLYDLLDDPVVHLIMKADDVSKDDILNLYDRDEDAPAASPPAYICAGLLGTVSRPEA
jgi:hypothetical protein